MRCTKWLSQNVKILSFWPWNFQKINFGEKYSIQFLKIKIFKKPYNMCVMYVLTIYICQIASQSVRKWFSYRPKALKMSIWTISKFVFWQTYAIQKDENSTIELPVKFCIETMLFVVKITALKFSPFFTGISQIHILTFTLTLTSHVTYL